MRTDTRLFRILGAIGLYKLALIGFVLLSPLFFPGIFNHRQYQANFHWPLDKVPDLATRFMTWDSQHYLYISEFGYDRPGTTTVGFMPFWPLVIRAFAWIGGGNHLLAALVLAQIFSAAGLVLFYDWVRKKSGEGAALGSLLLLLAYPGSFYLTVPYTEPLFLLLTLLLLRFLEERRWLGVFVVSALMPMTRAVGVVMVVPILWQLVRCREKPLRWLALAGPAVGLLGMMAIYYQALGDPLAYYRSQSTSFGVGARTSRLWDWIDFAKIYFRPQKPIFIGYPSGIFERLAFLWYAIALVFLARRRDKLGAVFAAAAGLVPALTLATSGFLRYFGVILPAFALESDPFTDPRRRFWFIAALGGLALVQAALFIRHILNYYVS